MRSSLSLNSTDGCLVDSCLARYVGSVYYLYGTLTSFLSLRMYVNALLAKLLDNIVTALVLGASVSNGVSITDTDLLIYWSYSTENVHDLVCSSVGAVRR